MEDIDPLQLLRLSKSPSYSCHDRRSTGHAVREFGGRQHKLLRLTADRDFCPCVRMPALQKKSKASVDSLKIHTFVLPSTLGNESDLNPMAWMTNIT